MDNYPYEIVITIPIYQFGYGFDKTLDSVKDILREMPIDKPTSVVIKKKEN